MTPGSLVRIAMVFLPLLSCVGSKPAWEDSLSPASEHAIVADRTWLRRTLPNGLRLLLLEDHSRPMVSLGLTVRRGVAMDPPGKEGVGILLGELMQRGAGERDALVLANAVEALGARLAVHAGWDWIRAGASGLSGDRDALLGFLADMVLRPRFEPAEVERARSEQLANLASSLDNPRTLLVWQLERTLFPDHRYGVPAAGLPETVAALSVDDVRAFHARVFGPNNAIFHVVGDFDSEAMFSKIEAAFGDWRPKPIPKPVPAPPRITPQVRKILVVDRPEMVQVQLAVAHEGLRRIDPRRIPASILNNVLGGSGFSSRLTVRLRSEEGLTYSIRSGFSLRRRPGRFGISTFTRTEELRPALDLLLSEVEAIRSNRPPTEQEVRDAKAFSIGRFALGLETSSAVLNSLVNLDVYGLPEDSLDTYRRRVNAVTADEVMQLARKLLHPARAAIVIVGSAEAILPQLEGLGAVDVVSWD